MSRNPLLLGGATLVLVAAVLVAGACADDMPTVTSAGLHEMDPLLSADAPPEVQAKIAELRRWSAPFHTLEGAAAAGYTDNIGCIDETVNGLDPSVARGMGYHITRGDKDLVNDGVVDINEPEFLVYAPAENDADLPKADRLEAARLVAFDYVLPGAPTDDPPEFFGEPFNWSPVFGVWMRHIYLWGNNPDGTFEDFSPAVRLCTPPLLDP